MKKLLVTILALALTIAGQAQEETVDTAQFIAVYNYECRTQNDEAAPVTDKMQVVVQVGRTVTKSMPYSVYRQRDESEEADVAADYQEAYVHIPTVWMGYPEGQVTVREFIFPHEYEGYELTPNIAWALSEDTMTVSSYLCQQATATFRGVEWHVWYTEEIPSSAGPWRLHGLPGLIVKAESKAHSFSIAKLTQEASPIIAPERRPDVQRMKYAKLLKHKNEIYGNRQYVKNPTYYVPDLQHSISHMCVFQMNGQDYIFANDHPLLMKAHVYHPLELTEQ